MTREPGREVLLPVPLMTVSVRSHWYVLVILVFQAGMIASVEAAVVLSSMLVSPVQRVNMAPPGTSAITVTGVSLW